MTNIEPFKYSGQHPEPIVDPYYNRDKVVFPRQFRVLSAESFFGNVIA